MANHMALLATTGSHLGGLWVSLEGSSSCGLSFAHRTTDQTPLTVLGGEAKRGDHMCAQKMCQEIVVTGR